MNLPIVILSGGYATRLRPITEKIPKALIPINGIPFIDWQLRLIKKQGFEEVVICLNYKSEMIREFLGNGSRFDLNIVISEDGDTPLGTGGALKKALGLLGEKFVVLYGDSYLDFDYKRAELAFLQTSKSAMMAIYKNQNNYDKSNVQFSKDMPLKYSKKGKLDTMSYIDFGMNFFNRKAFENLELGRSFDLSEILEKLSDKNELEGYEVNDRFYEIGSMIGIKDLSQYLERKINVI
jgi:NDP-sugar pyrophosphorylase family protein